MYLDARGLRCPMPLLKLKQALHGLAVDDILTVTRRVKPSCVKP